MTVLPHLAVLLHNFKRTRATVNNALGDEKFNDVLEWWAEPATTNREMKVT